MSTTTTTETKKLEIERQTENKLVQTFDDFVDLI